MTQKPFCLAFGSDLNPDELQKKLGCIEIDPESVDAFLGEGELPDVDKYDCYLPDELRRQAYLANELDAQAAMDLFQNKDSSGTEN